MKELTVSKEESGRRLDKYLLKYLSGAPRSFVYKTLRKKNVGLNGRNASGAEILAPGDRIKLFLSDGTIENFSPVKRGRDSESGPPGDRPAQKNINPLSIIFEDENLLICDKPAGLLSQPAGLFDADTMIGRILGYLETKNEYGPDLKTFTPALMNRLDRNTSGLVVAAKNLPAAQAASEMIRERRLDRIYLAVVAGRVERAGRLEDYYIKDTVNNIGMIVKNADGRSDAGNNIRMNVTGADGRSRADKSLKAAELIVTEYAPLFAGEDYSLVEARLVTGKSHQIRAHMQSAGHPVVGDIKYGDAAVNGRAYKKFGVKRQMLHAWKIVFNADRGPLKYLRGVALTAEPPGDFMRLPGFNI